MGINGASLNTWQQCSKSPNQTRVRFYHDTLDGLFKSDSDNDRPRRKKQKQASSADIIEL